MDREAMLDAYDRQVRRRPTPESAHERIECEPRVVRIVPEREGWAGVTWSDLDAEDADATIAAQVERFSERMGAWEWKHYSYDRPPDLPERLLAAGFASEPVESLLAADLSELSLEVAPPPGVELTPVLDRAAAQTLVWLQDEVFGGGTPGMVETLLHGLASEPGTAAAVIATVAGVPVAGGRIQFYPGTEFAGLWGGCTHADYRGQGIFRSLVAYRARLAAERGFRYLQVDASEDSRPILLGLGFVELARTTPFQYCGAARAAAGAEEVAADV